MTRSNRWRSIAGNGLVCVLCTATLVGLTPLARASDHGHDSHGSDSHGGDSHGHDSHDSHGGDSHGSDSHGSDSHGSDSHGDDHHGDDHGGGDCHGGDHDGDDDDGDDDDGETTLYVWASDQARIANDFLVVVDFDPHSHNYGKVLETVPVDTSGNEAHHCHLSADKNTLARGGLLSLLKGQDDVFFFDVSDARHPVYRGSTHAVNSAITDDFLPLDNGGFLVTMMGSATGGGGGRVAEFDKYDNLVAEYPNSPDSLFDPHGISARTDLNLMVTSDFVDPASTLNAVAGDPQFRHAIRVWNLSARTITRTIDIPDAVGTMDTKLIPGDPQGRAVTASMLTGLVYTIDTATGTYSQSFDCEDIVPHVETDIEGGMVQLITMPDDGNRMIFASFQAGQIGQLDITDRYHFVQLGNVVDLGFNSGPHNHLLTADQKRLVVSDYFLDEDDFGKVHFDGDHKVHVVDVTTTSLALESNFNLDFNTAFSTGPARPHGMAVK